MVGQDLSRCPTLNCSPFVLTPPLCWHQEQNPGGPGSGVRALGLGLLWLLKDQEGGPEPPSFLYQLSSPAGDPPGCDLLAPSAIFTWANKDRKIQLWRACFRKKKKKKRQQKPFNT